MFYHIRGKLTDVEPNLAVVEAAGVGYALHTTANTISHIRQGEDVKLYVYENIREDVFDLYGFYDKREKSCFEMLVGVSGVGPKAALSILSSTTPEGLAMAIINGDEKALTVAQGIGKKIAQRILLELKDKMSKETDGLVVSTGKAEVQTKVGSKLNDAIAALMVLGYTNSEISSVLKGMDTETMTTEEIIKTALKMMVK